MGLTVRRQTVKNLTVNRQNRQNLTVNRQSYTPIETLFRFGGTFTRGKQRSNSQARKRAKHRGKKERMKETKGKEKNIS